MRSEYGNRFVGALGIAVWGSLTASFAFSELGLALRIGFITACLVGVIWSAGVLFGVYLDAIWHRRDFADGATPTLHERAGDLLGLLVCGVLTVDVLVAEHEVGWKVLLAGFGILGTAWYGAGLFGFDFEGCLEALAFERRLSSRIIRS